MVARCKGSMLNVKQGVARNLVAFTSLLQHQGGLRCSAARYATLLHDYRLFEGYRHRRPRSGQLTDLAHTFTPNTTHALCSPPATLSRTVASRSRYDGRQAAYTLLQAQPRGQVHDEKMIRVSWR